MCLQMFMALVRFEESGNLERGEDHYENEMEMEMRRKC